MAAGKWIRGDLCLEWARRSSRRIVPDVERSIEQAWVDAAGVPGVHLFDGPMCRLESLDATPAWLRMTVSPTTYKTFLGTNLRHPQFAETHGRDVLANPIGVSTLLETADGYLVLGVRNASVAYYPNRIHPVAGALEPIDQLDPFNTAFRELSEEVGLQTYNISQIHCLGVVEDQSIFQPELILTARTTASRHAIVAAIDPKEHQEAWAVAIEPKEVGKAMQNPLLTPVAKAAIFLWRRAALGVTLE